MKIELDEFQSRIEGRLTPTQTNIHKWTAEEFERLVFACKPKVAVFDCDGTLWSGDAGYEFMVWSLEQGLVSRSTHDWIDTRYRAYLAGSVSEEAICGEMVQMYAGLRDGELRAAAAEYVDKFVRERIFAEMAALVASMRKAGHRALGCELDQPLGGRRGSARFRNSGGAHSGSRGSRGRRSHYE